MSEHQQWKMIHLLHRSARPSGGRSVLTYEELVKAGVHCHTDTICELVTDGIVNNYGDEYEISAPAAKMISHFTVAAKKDTKEAIRVDYPDAFVIMPFNKPWSDNVYVNMIKAGIEDAQFNVLRGDTIVRIGDLSTNVWKQITRAGIIVADVSAPNPNVYYEIGLADALGKPIFLFKQEDVKLPADFGGEHYYTYDLNKLDAGRKTLADELNKWAEDPDHKPFGVKALVDRATGGGATHTV